VADFSPTPSEDSEDSAGVKPDLRDVTDPTLSCFGVLLNESREFGGNTK
jgi:hypothetical protein